MRLLIRSVAKINIAKAKHNKASANYMHFAHINLACVLDIIDATPNAIVSHLFPDDEYANQVFTLEFLQALETRFATLWATDIVKIKAIFDVP